MIALLLFVVFSLCGALSSGASVRPHSSFLSLARRRVSAPESKNAGHQDAVDEYKGELNNQMTYLANKTAMMTCLRFRGIGDGREAEMRKVAGVLQRAKTAMNERRQALQAEAEYALNLGGATNKFDAELRKLDLSNPHSINAHLAELMKEHQEARLMAQESDELHKGVELFSARLLDPLEKAITDAHNTVSDQVIPIRKVFYDTTQYAEVTTKCSETMQIPKSPLEAGAKTAAGVLDTKSPVIETGNAVQQLMTAHLSHQLMNDELKLHKQVLKIVQGVKTDLENRAADLLSKVFGDLDQFFQTILFEDKSFTAEVLKNAEVSKRRETLKAAYNKIKDVSNTTFDTPKHLITEAQSVIALELTKTAPTEFNAVFTEVSL